MSKRKILFIITGLKRGGAERQLFNLIEGIKDQYDIQVLAFDDGYFKKKLENIGIDVQLEKIKTNLGFLKALYYTRKKIQQFKPDIVQSMLPHSNIVAKFANLLTSHRFKLINGVRNSQVPKGLGLLEKLTDSLSDKIVTNSNTNKDNLVQRGFDKDKIQVVYNGKKFKEPNQTYNYDTKTILTVAKFYPQKDYPTNIKTIEKLDDKIDNFQALYVGDGPLKEQMKKRVKEKGLDDKISFLGYRDDIPELMSSSDVLFLPTKYEGQANVLLEAMYYGLPIVTTDIPENKEICQAFFQDVGDDKGMANSLEKILNGSVEIDEKIVNNKKRVGQFSIENMIDSYLDVYEKI